MQMKVVNVFFCLLRLPFSASERIPERRLWYVAHHFVPYECKLGNSLPTFGSCNDEALIICPDESPLLLLSTEDELQAFCPQTNETKLIAVGDFRGLSFSSHDGGTIIARDDEKIVHFPYPSVGKVNLLPEIVLDLAGPLHRCLNANSGKVINFVRHFCSELLRVCDDNHFR